jgi:radical SAM protein with 4Fe4S-binding SPASM domain
MAESRLSDLIRAKATEKKIPLFCQLDLTHHCNLNCLHCYVTKENRDELETSEIKHILDEMAAMGTLYLGLSGGEVLTREDFFEIGEYARKLHFALRILTNGTLIDEEVADKIAALNPEEIKISIYSSDPEIHDKITGVPGSFEKSIKAAEMLKKRNLKLRISTVVMKHNIDNYHQVYEISERLGATFGADPIITAKSNGDKSPLKLRIKNEELYEVLAYGLLKEKHETETLKENCETEPEKDHVNPVNDILCCAAHSLFNISPYGDVFPCVQLPINCGNVKESSLEEIWYHSTEMLKIRSMVMSDLPVCSKCEFIDCCLYCPGIPYLEEDDLMVPSEIKCQEAIFLKQLKSDENGKKEKIPKTSS